jgi:hypothetical protein
MLSPDFDVEITDVTQTWNGAGYTVAVAFHVENKNPYSASNTKALSGRTRNSEHYIYVLLDGEYLTHWAETIDGGAARNFAFSFDVPAYTSSGAGEYTLEIKADYYDQLWELDESNNDATYTLSTLVDLMAHVEIAGPYVNHPGEYVKPADAPAGYYYWKELTYNVTARNLAKKNTSPPCDLKIYYENMWSDSSTLSSQSFSIGALAPDQSQTIQFTVSVPMDMYGRISGSTRVLFCVDGDGLDVNDSDRSNNTVELELNQDYFRPDYQIQFTSFSLDSSTGVVVEAVVKNMGPEPATKICGAGLYFDGAQLLNKNVPILHAAGKTNLTFRADPFVAVAMSHTFTLKVDGTKRIDENNEDNNVDTLVYGQDVDLSLPEFFEQDFYIVGDWLVPEIDRSVMLFESMFMSGEEMAEWVFANSGNGPFLPEVLYNQTMDRYVIYNTAAYRQLSVYVR